MRIFISIIFILSVILGCSANNGAALIWFDTLDAAIQNGIQREEITESDILGKLEKDNEFLIIFKTKLSEGTGLGVASIAKESGKFAWYRADQPVLVKYSNKEKV